MRGLLFSQLPSPPCRPLCLQSTEGSYQTLTVLKGRPGSQCARCTFCGITSERPYGRPRTCTAPGTIGFPHSGAFGSQGLLKKSTSALETASAGCGTLGSTPGVTSGRQLKGNSAHLQNRATSSCQGLSFFTACSSVSRRDGVGEGGLDNTSLYHIYIWYDIIHIYTHTQICGVCNMFVCTRDWRWDFAHICTLPQSYMPSPFSVFFFFFEIVLIPFPEKSRICNPPASVSYYKPVQPGPKQSFESIQTINTVSHMDLTEVP